MKGHAFCFCVPVGAVRAVEPKLTPAVLEQLCAEHEEIEDFLVALEKQVSQCCQHAYAQCRASDSGTSLWVSDHAGVRDVSVQFIVQAVLSFTITGWHHHLPGSKIIQFDSHIELTCLDDVLL